MLRQLLVGGAVCICNIAIHALVMTAVIHVAQRVAAKERSHAQFYAVAVMISTVCVLMAAHVLQIGVWAWAYALVGIAPAGTDLLYFSFVNFTTLGYGDVIPSEHWRLLGPITAMNGVLLFGWSTAVIFEVLQRTLRRR